MPIQIGSTYVHPSSYVRYLGVYLDSDISFSEHVTKTASLCFSILRNLKCIRRSLPRSLLISLIVSLVFSRLDYCVSILNGTCNPSQTTPKRHSCICSSRFSIQPLRPYLTIGAATPMDAGQWSYRAASGCHILLVLSRLCSYLPLWRTSRGIHSTRPSTLEIVCL